MFPPTETPEDGEISVSHGAPEAPWQNPWVESYGSRMHDELLSIEQLDSLLEARVLVDDWREE